MRKNKSSVILIRAITAGYISLSLFFTSLLSYDGFDIYFQDIFFVIIKIFFFIIGLFFYPVLINKKILPNFNKNYNCNNLKYIWIAPSLVVFFKEC